MSLSEILESILNASDKVEEARVMDGDRLLEERFSSASIGKRICVVHVYTQGGTRMFHNGILLKEESY